MLPEQKSDFPKCLYLDQNKWIDLAKAHHGKDGGTRFRDALDAVREAVQKGSLVVPMSAIHIMETMAPANEGRRTRLAEFMVDLSGNRSILTQMAFRPIEILHAVIRQLGLQPRGSIRANIISEGLPFALGAETVITGVPSEIAQELHRVVHSPEASVRYLVQGDRENVATARLEDEQAVIELEETRRRAHEAMSGEMRHRVELAELFTSGKPGAELRQILRSIGMPAPAFLATLGTPDDYLTFFHEIPSIDVWVTLSMERDKDFNRRIHRNDAKDIGFLSVALPHANVIVCEKFWGHISNATGLAGKYGTEVLTDAAELPTVLERQRCL